VISRRLGQFDHVHWRRAAALAAGSAFERRRELPERDISGWRMASSGSLDANQTDPTGLNQNTRLARVADIGLSS
jgi:hypothetical protein